MGITVIWISRLLKSDIAGPIIYLNSTQIDCLIEFFGHCYHSSAHKTYSIKRWIIKRNFIIIILYHWFFTNVINILQVKFPLEPNLIWKWLPRKLCHLDTWWTEEEFKKQFIEKCEIKTKRRCCCWWKKCLSLWNSRALQSSRQTFSFLKVSQKH